jgi:hypothetical protein
MALTGCAAIRLKPACYRMNNEAALVRSAQGQTRRSNL